MPCLTCNNLSVSFSTHLGSARAVRGLSFSVDDSATLGVVGESGCGKSVTALSIMRLVPSPAGRIESGEIIFEGRNLLALSDDEMRRIRGNRIGMIFQDPMTSLNPVYTCGWQVDESVMLHKKAAPKEARELTLNMFGRVGITEPQRIYSAYPHQLSGGLRQRVMIAMALCAGPRLLLADEPTTALDVTVQATILDLLRQLQKELGMSVIIITHDLGIISDLARDVIIMYAGEIVEQATSKDLFDEPLHPYTVGLLQSIPRLDRKQARLQVIPGEVPTPQSLPSGCPFHPRCRHCMERCRIEHPGLTRRNNNRHVRCFLYE